MPLIRLQKWVNWTIFPRVDENKCDETHLDENIQDF